MTDYRKSIGAERVVCDCGSNVQLKNMSTHQLTKKHQLAIRNQVARGVETEDSDPETELEELLVGRKSGKDKKSKVTLDELATVLLEIQEDVGTILDILEDDMDDANDEEQDFEPDDVSKISEVKLEEPKEVKPDPVKQEKATPTPKAKSSRKPRKNKSEIKGEKSEGKTKPSLQEKSLN